MNLFKYSFILAFLGFFGCKTYHKLDFNLEKEINDFQTNLPQANLESALLLADAEKILITNNKKFKIQVLSLIKKAGIEAEFAGLWNDPEFSFEPERYLSKSDKTYALGGSFSLDIPINGIKKLEKKLAEMQNTSAILELEMLKKDLILQLRVAWYRNILLTEKLLQVEKFFNIISTINFQVKKLKEIGEYDILEANTMEVLQKNADLIYANLKVEKEISYLDIMNLLGFYAGNVMQLSNNLPNISTRLAFDEAEEIIKNSPQVLLQNAKFLESDQRYQVELRRQYPDLKFSLGYSSDAEDRMMPLGISLVLPLWNRNKLGMGLAENARLIQKEEVLSTAYDIIAQLQKNILRCQLLSAEIKVLEEQILPLIDKNFAIAQRRLENGDGDFFLLADSLERWNETHGKINDLRLAQLTLIEEINFLVNRSDKKNIIDDKSPKGENIEEKKENLEKNKNEK